MKKFTLVSLVAAAAFATTAAFSASNVFAADDGATPTSDTTSTPAVSDGNKSAQTTGDITLTKANGTDDTKYPYTDITLVKAAKIDFGSMPVETAAKTYNATNEDTVNVVNPGVASGWTVKAAASDFTGSTGTLKGAVLTLGFKDAVAAETNKSAAPSATKGAVITGAGDVVFSAADSNTGVGDWSTTVDKATTTLAVPAGNVAGTYKADITWTLENTVK